MLTKKVKINFFNNILKDFKENLGIKRPGSGISPMKWKKILGKFSKRNYKIDQLIKLK